MDTRLKSLGRLAAERPRTLLLVWVAALAPLIALGVGVEDRLHRATLQIPGTKSNAATELSRRHFGESDTLVVLLRGRPETAARQGRRLAAAFERHEGVAVLAPWMPGANRALRPEPSRTLLIVRIQGPSEHVSRNVVPALRDQLGRVIRPPLRANLSGYSDIATGIHTASVEAARQAELIAAPLLLIVLLLVFRSPIAAALPLLMGITTIGAGAGMLELVRHLMSVDALALNLMSMFGLALGVDYGLLLVSRFRQELAGGAQERQAVAVAVETAGRTVFFAALALGLAMTVAFFVAPGRLIASGSVGVVTGVLMSMLGALIAVPAMLALLGRRIDRWRFGSATAGAGGRFGAGATRALGRPAVAAGAVLVFVAVLSAPALALQTGPPDPGVLPSDSPERQDYEVVREELGRGWSAPYQITVAARGGRITEGRRMEAIARWQRRLAFRPDVSAVMGPQRVAARAERIEEIPAGLEAAEGALRRGRRDQTRLAEGLARASGGIDELTSGLSRAAEAAARIESGAGAASGGSGTLRGGLQQARSGAGRVAEGIAKAQRGAARLAGGAGSGIQAAARIRDGIEQAEARTRGSIPSVEALATGIEQGGSDLDALREPAQLAEGQLQRAKQELEAMPASAKTSPSYLRAYEAVAVALGAVSGRHPLTGDPVVEGYPGLDAALASASTGARASGDAVRQAIGNLGGLADGLTRLRAGSTRLRNGLIRVEDRLSRLKEGLKELGGGGAELASGLRRLPAGAGSLAEGIDRLQAGTSSLEQRLADGLPRSRELGAGVTRMDREVAAARASLDARSDQLTGSQRLAAITRSDYFPLAALDSAGPAQRHAASFAINTSRGGSAAELVVVPTGNPVRKGHPLREVLAEDLESLEREADVITGVGGPAAVLQDFDAATYESLPSLVLVLVLVTYLVLVPVLRSVVLPLIAVLLNLLSVAAAFGALVILFQGSSPLGGPGFIDAVMVAGIFTVVFGLSIDYEVFLLTRIREGYILTGTTDGAVAFGLHHTAGVITGAALIMTGVFIAFALTDLASLRQLGVGLTVAVLLDATLIRLVLLPAAIKLCGRANWWYPGGGRSFGTPAQNGQPGPRPLAGRPQLVDASPRPAAAAGEGGALRPALSPGDGAAREQLHTEATLHDGPAKGVSSTGDN